MASRLCCRRFPHRFPAPTLLTQQFFAPCRCARSPPDLTRPGYVYVVEAIQVQQDGDAGEIVFAGGFQGLRSVLDQISPFGPNPSNASEVDPSMLLFTMSSTTMTAAATCPR